MKDIYSENPRFQNKSFLVRKISKNDIDELMKVYSDKDSLPLFNSDNCHGDTFYYPTLEKMQKAYNFWTVAYKNKWFTRLTIIDRNNNLIIGTFELFLRSSFDSFDDTIVLRLDLKSEYENKTTIFTLLSLIIPKIPEYFGNKKIITKGWTYATERVEALKKFGFILSKRKLIGDNNREYDNYYVYNKRR
jgi:ribosomal-protein-alanine N-acetyltransferase